MKEVKDIVLKKGDRVTLYYCDGEEESFIIDNDKTNRLKFNAPKISSYKIERPMKYETIYEAPKQILDQKEKEYLENVIRPIKNRVNSIAKSYAILTQCKKEEIVINYDNKYGSCLPHFTKGTMYKGMELNRKYTLKELGLFE